jgi:CHASE3 domain sensor protein
LALHGGGSSKTFDELTRKLAATYQGELTELRGTSTAEAQIAVEIQAANKANKPENDKAMEAASKALSKKRDRKKASLE